jgi:hypothetical protein
MSYNELISFFELFALDSAVELGPKCKKNFEERRFGVFSFNRNANTYKL